MNALYVLYNVHLPVETKSLRMKRVGFSRSLLVSLKANAIFTQMSRMKIYFSVLRLSGIVVVFFLIFAQEHKK
jgi:hypothetical protein